MVASPVGLGLYGLNESHPLVSSEIVTALPFGISHGSKSRVSK